MHKLLAVIVLLVVTGCGAIANWQENPARAKVQTELAGNVVMSVYFVTDDTADKHARDIVATIDAITAVVAQTPTALPADFASFMPAIDARLGEVLTDNARAFLPSAHLLALMLLQELQLKADAGQWLAAPPENVRTVMEMVGAFFKGARDAAAVFVAAPL